MKTLSGNVVARPQVANLGILSLLVAPHFLEVVKNNLHKLNRFIEIAHKKGVPMPEMYGSFDYILQLGSLIVVSNQVTVPNSVLNDSASVG